MWTINAGDGSPVSSHATNLVLDLMRLVESMRFVDSNVSFQTFQNFPVVVHNGSQNLLFEAKVIRENCLFYILSYIKICSSNLMRA